MKIGAKITLFNWEMRERRAELGMTQADLAFLCGLSQTDISSIERLNQVGGDWLTKLEAISDELDTEFNDLFPEDYITSLVENQLPHPSHPPLIMMREAELAELLASSGRVRELAEQEPQTLESVVYSDVVKTEIRRVLEAGNPQSVLSEREREILRLRWQNDTPLDRPLTLKETGEYFGLSRERIRQQEKEALRKLRHPEVGLTKFRIGTFRGSCSRSDSLKKWRRTLDNMTLSELKSFSENVPHQDSPEFIVYEDAALFEYLQQRLLEERSRRIERRSGRFESTRAF